MPPFTQSGRQSTVMIWLVSARYIRMERLVHQHWSPVVAQSRTPTAPTFTTWQWQAYLRWSTSMLMVATVDVAVHRCARCLRHHHRRWCTTAGHRLPDSVEYQPAIQPVNEKYWNANSDSRYCQLYPWITHWTLEIAVFCTLCVCIHAISNLILM